METVRKKVLLLGIGYFEKELLKAIALKWDVIAVDMNEEKVRRLQVELPALAYVVGDASSILTWKRLNLDEVGHIITAIHDQDVNLEVCMIVREILRSDVPVTILSYGAMEEKRFKQFNADLFNPVALGVNFILNKVEKNYVRAGDIGLKKGEIIEVPILARSNLVGRKLKHLRPANWHVAAIYRDGEMLIPTGETEIKVRDTIVLLGDPVVLESVANILLKGEPQFPLQFGASVAFPLHNRFEKNFEELHYLQQFLKTGKLLGCPYKVGIDEVALDKVRNHIPSAEPGTPIRSLKDLFGFIGDVGLVFVPYGSLSIFERRVAKLFFQKATKPFFFSRLQNPYQGIVSSLNCLDPAYALEFGVDLSRLFELPLKVVYVTMPKELRGNKGEESLKERALLVSDFESIYKIKISYTVLEGNPVKSTIDYLKGQEKHLLILLYSKKDPFSPFQPHTQYLIAKKSPLSTLLIPVEAVYEQ